MSTLSWFMSDNPYVQYWYEKRKPIEEWEELTDVRGGRSIWETGTCHYRMLRALEFHAECVHINVKIFIELAMLVKWEHCGDRDHPWQRPQTEIENRQYSPSLIKNLTALAIISPCLELRSRLMKMGYDKNNPGYWRQEQQMEDDAERVVCAILRRYLKPEWTSAN